MSFDLTRQRSTTMGLGPYALTVDAGFETLASRYAVGVTIFVGLQGLDAAGAPVAQRMVGTGQLLANGTLQIDTTTTPAAPVSFACDSIVVVVAQSVAAVQALIDARLEAITTLVGNSPTIDIGGAPTQLLAATGAVTITATGYAPGRRTTTVVENTTASPIAVTVVPAFAWYTPATLSLPAGKIATLSTTSTTSSASGVIASLVAGL